VFLFLLCLSDRHSLTPNNHARGREVIAIGNVTGGAVIEEEGGEIFVGRGGDGERVGG
jgi:hypothetical protein